MRPIKLPKSSVNRFRRQNLFLSIGGFWRRILPVLLIIILLYLLNSLFTIRRVDCSLDGKSCPEEIIQKLNRYRDSNVLLLNQKQISESLRNSLPLEKVGLGFKLFNTMQITLEGGHPPLSALVYLVRDLPVVSMDSATGSTLSADWPRPSVEINLFSRSASSSGFNLWDSGQMTPVATEQSNISYIIAEKPDTETIKSLYRLVKLVNKYLNIETIQIVGNRVFLSQADEPDIIVSVPFDELQVSEAIKSYTYLATIKKDAKVIDLRFKNPIIR